MRIMVVVFCFIEVVVVGNDGCSCYDCNCYCYGCLRLQQRRQIGKKEMRNINKKDVQKSYQFCLVEGF